MKRPGFRPGRSISKYYELIYFAPPAFGFAPPEAGLEG
jgi:hypothetical protein